VELTVHPAGGGLRGRLRVPGDKSISHRALLLAARAPGLSTINGLSDGADVAATARAVAAFGASVSYERGAVLVGGCEPREAETVIDVGNSGTAIRLLTGWAAGVDGLTVLHGDGSVAGRPMGRVAEPIRLMGAHVDGRMRGSYPPLAVRGGDLHGIDYSPPVASAQVKGAVLLAGLSAQGPTRLVEKVPTRAHTEEMLALFGAHVEVEGPTVTLHPGPLHPARVDVPGDPSQAAFWVVAACITPGSDLVVEDVYTGPQRTAFLDVLRRMGADVAVEPPGGTTAAIRARHGPLAATDVSGEEVPGLIDEIPVLAVAAAYAAGVSTFSGAAELRVKESDRATTTVSAIKSLGGEAEERPDGLTVKGSGGRRLAGGRVSSFGDHRIAMAAAVAGLAASGPVVVAGWESVQTSYPRFAEDLARCVS
jgi:3-phosphoshikimate 1-carboxyvinyltransferase